MDNPETKAESQKLEKLATDGESNALAKELHSLDPEARLAVSRQIQADAQNDTTGLLPKMEFASTGDLKSFSDVDRQGPDHHKEAIRRDYDPSTGNLELVEAHGSDGSMRGEFRDPKTGNPELSVNKAADGSMHTVAYQPDGQIKEIINENPEGKVTFKQVRDYDQAGKLMDVAQLGPDGTTQFFDYAKGDSPTQQQPEHKKD